jgi:hypothetical protein
MENCEQILSEMTAIILPFPEDYGTGRFLDSMCGDGPWHIVAIRKDPKTIEARDYPASDSRCADAQEWGAAWADKGFGVYFAINPLRSSLGRKATKDDVSEARCGEASNGGCERERPPGQHRRGGLAIRLPT